MDTNEWSQHRAPAQHYEKRDKRSQECVYSVRCRQRCREMISMLMHGSRRITAETVADVQTRGVKGQDSGSCPHYTASPQELL